jgi:XTP/dITP diphosphohydrolase
LKRFEIVIATKNRGKVAEFWKIFEEMGAAGGYTLLTLADFPDYPDVEESGATFEENALKKARFAARTTGRIAIADDSGIEVDTLNGAPGVMSARFSGADADDQKNNEKLLGLLAGVPKEKRTARFVAVIAIVSPSGREKTVRGECRGVVTAAPRGKSGFGYDPVFFYPPLNKTYAEMTDIEKNGISHRRRAVEALCGVLTKFLEK